MRQFASRVQNNNATAFQEVKPGYFADLLLCAKKSAGAKQINLGQGGRLHANYAKAFHLHLSPVISIDRKLEGSAKSIVRTLCSTEKVVAYLLKVSIEELNNSFISRIVSRCNSGHCLNFGGYVI